MLPKAEKLIIPRYRPFNWTPKARAVKVEAAVIHIEGRHKVSLEVIRCPTGPAQEFAVVGFDFCSLKDR